MPSLPGACPPAGPGEESHAPACSAVSHELHLLLPPHKTKKQPSAVGAGPSMPSWGHCLEETEPEQPRRILETKRKEKEKKIHNQFPSSNTLATLAPFFLFDL